MKDNALAPSKLHHKPQLDALRGIAVSAVLLHHFLPMERIIPADFLTLGLLAVRLFFVLSGYLITGILLQYRSLAFLHALKQFYFRRALRIFPIYYLTLLVTAVISVPHIRQFIVWHLFYLSNVLNLLHPMLIGPTGHLWTLSVEEQFYLVWPFVILLVPYKHLLKTILTVIGVGLLWKAIIAYTLGNHMAGSGLMPACLDSLAIGGLLALVEHDETLRIHREKFLRFLSIAGIATISIQCIAYMAHHATRLVWTTFYLGVSLFFAWLVARASESFGGRFGMFLENRTLRFIGKISYGMYLYHFFMPGLVTYASNAVGLRPFGIPANFAAATALTFIVASISWYAIERPIGVWKNKSSVQDQHSVS
jgi:peptidoglycan/LPS O-acetylase OafA/YrhL